MCFQNLHQLVIKNDIFYHQRNIEKLLDGNPSVSRIRQEKNSDQRRYDVLIDVHLICQRLLLVRHDGHVLLALEDTVGMCVPCLHDMHMFTLVFSRSHPVQSGEHQIRLSVVVVVRFFFPDMKTTR